MDFNIQIDISQSQNLILTPQLQQSLSILKMDSDELNNLVDDQLLKNPVLEISESYYYQRKNYVFDNKTDYMNSIPDMYSSEEELVNVLMAQLQVYSGALSQEESDVIKFLIYSLDHKGYPPYSTEEISEHFEISKQLVESAIAKLKQFEPKGVGSKNLEECLLCQTENPATQVLIENHLQDIASNNISKIKNITGLETHTIHECIQSIKAMNPIPSSGYGVLETKEFINPDFIVKEKGNSFEVEYIKKKYSHVTINSKYLEFLQQKKNSEFEDDYKKTMVSEARYFIKAIKQREDTLEKILTTLVAKQKSFFEKGKLYLATMSMRDVAEMIDMHESTISRAINGKYLQCKWGTFELKYFFSNKLKQKSNRATESMNPMVLLEKVVEEEDKKKPLSDEKISKILKMKGINISRRTVTKYREKLKIPSSKERKMY